MPKETRLQEIKRCLDRATELGGSSLGDEATYIESPYGLNVSDVRFLYDKLEAILHYATGCDKNPDPLNGGICHPGTIIDMIQDD